MTIHIRDMSTGRSSSFQVPKVMAMPQMAPVTVNAAAYGKAPQMAPVTYQVRRRGELEGCSCG